MRTSGIVAEKLRAYGVEIDVDLRNPAFVLDDVILPVGASIYARIVETRLPKA